MYRLNEIHLLFFSFCHHTNDDDINIYRSIPTPFYTQDSVNSDPREMTKRYRMMVFVLPGESATLLGVSKMILPSSVRHGRRPCSKRMTFSGRRPKKLWLRKNVSVASFVCSLVMMYLLKSWACELLNYLQMHFTTNTTRKTVICYYHQFFFKAVFCLF